LQQSHRDHPAPYRPPEEHAPVLSARRAADLFGQWCLICEWGRIGSAGQVRKILYDSEAAAVAALERLQHGNNTGAISHD
jgi:hypothetical protein